MAARGARAARDDAGDRIPSPRLKAIVNINKGKAFYGDVDILGKPYVTGYDPIKDASGKVIGIWYVGYEKNEATRGFEAQR